MAQTINIQVRRDTAANWSTTGTTTNGNAGNPILNSGEFGFETDTGKFKLGDGTNTWNLLTSYYTKTGIPLGAASLDSSGKVTATQIPTALAPATLTATGIVTGSNLSGANTGDQSLTGLGGFPVAGGTLTGAINEAGPVTLASAATVAIGAAAANTINITGAVAITAFDTIAAGAERNIIFAGTLTLTYSATALILPSVASITTAAGDAARMVSLGAGNWKCLSYTRASGGALVNSAQIALTSVNNWSLTQTSTEMAVAYAATVTLDAATVSNHINIGVLTGNIVLANPTSFVNAVLLNIWLTQDATGSRLLSLGSNIKTSGGAGILLSTAPNAIDFLTLSYNPTKGIWIAVIAKGVA